MADGQPRTGIAVEPVLEKNTSLQEWATRENGALLAFVAPDSGVRSSPVSDAYATIGVQEEFGIESFIDHCTQAKFVSSSNKWQSLPPRQSSFISKGNVSFQTGVSLQSRICL